MRPSRLGDWQCGASTPRPGAQFDALLLDAAGQPETVIRVILAEMTTSPRQKRPIASSPFRPDPEPVIEQYALGDLVSHDSYGVGHVVQMEAAAVMVDFRSQKVRITSPFHKMAKL